MAHIVPFGMALRGFSRSPLMLAPAMMPVEAGKKTAKTSQKLAPGVSPLGLLAEAPPV